MEVLRYIWKTMTKSTPILCDKWKTERHTYPVPFQNASGMAKNIKIPKENFSFFQWCATNRAIFSEWDWNEKNSK